MIRPITAADQEQWARLFHAYGIFYETEFDSEVLESTWALLSTEGSGIDAIVAERDGVVVGFAHYRSHPDTFSTGRDWFLDDLYVDPGARSTGTATALIEHVAELMRSSGQGTLRWITAESNERAQRIYDRVATRTTWVTYELGS
jgi:ribosomal protein S18 acetylase RimI-like enzyme